MDRTIRSLKYMDNFMGKFEFFKENPRVRHKVLNNFLASDFSCIEEECKDLETFEVYDIFREKFGNYLGDYDVLVSALCADLNTRRKRIKSNEQRIAELNKELINERSKKPVQEPVQEPETDDKKKLLPEISVIIPMYNAQDFIIECLKSLKLQTFKDFEIIVVDDCSTDNSVKLVKAFAKKFNMQIKTAKTKKNSGGGGYIPRNIGLTILLCRPRWKNFTRRQKKPTPMSSIRLLTIT